MSMLTVRKQNFENIKFTSKTVRFWGKKDIGRLRPGVGLWVMSEIMI